MAHKKLSPLLVMLLATQSFSATEEVIVTGSYSPVNNEQLSSSVSIINHEQLLQLSSHSLVDALRQLPSIWVEEQGGPGGVTAISLRGAESNHTLVLLDGVQLNDPTNTRGGAFDLNGINIESVARIEIIRGSQSSVYGYDALAGTIHIITTEAGKNATQLNTSLGEDNYKTAGISTSGKINQIGYAFTAQTKDAGEPELSDRQQGGIASGSTAKNHELISKLNWSNTIHQLDFTYRYFSGERTAFPEQSGGPVFAVSRERDASDYTDQSSALGWRMQVNNFWQSKTQVSWYNRDENISSPGIAPFDAVPANGAETEFTRTNVQWINTLGNQQSMWSNIGLETKHEDGVSKGYLDFGFKMPTDFSLARTINSAFINLNGYATKDLLLNANLRRDEATDSASNKKIAAKNSTQAGARYQLNAALNVFVNAGQGFKLPSFFALGHPLIGNSQLKPETASTRDIGIEWQQSQYTASIGYFDHHYRNLIDFDSETFRNVNRSRVETSGIEAEANWQATPQLQLGAHGTYTDIDMLSSNNHLLGRPQTKVGASTSYLINNNWKINVNCLWVSSRFAVSRYTSTDVEQTLDAYNRIDTTVTWQISTKAKLDLQLENIADEHYYNDIGFPAIGRSALLNFNLTL
jgi:vitamin B12 transporter